jgi:hypothetical protein
VTFSTLLQHLLLGGLWLVAHLPWWVWLVVGAWTLLWLVRSGAIMPVLALGMAVTSVGRGTGRGVRRLHGNPMALLAVVVIAVVVIGHAVGAPDGGPGTAPAAALTSVDGPGTVYTNAQLAGALSGLGEMPGNARIGAAVAQAESGGRANALNNTARPDLPGYRVPGPGARPEYSVGPWQINLLAHTNVSVSCAQDLTCAAQAADGISSHGMDWGAWSTYTSGAFRAHLN